jgi:glycosyltransferase involved in cell wall biosynthesis
MRQPNDPAWSKPTISVVMATYNRCALLPAVVESLLADESTHEIVVVVDGSQDGSFELLEEMAPVDRRLRPFLIENQGKMAARQVGVQAAEGDFVLLFDDDQIADEGLVSGHLETQLRCAPGTLVVGYVPTPVPERQRGTFTTELYARAYEFRCDEYERNPDTILRNLMTGNLSLRREDCLRVGLSSPSYTARYHADRDFGLRCLKGGLTATFDRSLSGIHVYERSARAFFSDARDQGRGTAYMHLLHEDVLGPLGRETLTVNLPPPARLLVVASRRERVRRAVEPVLRAAVQAAGPVRLLGLEKRFAQVVRRIEFQRGILDVQPTLLDGPGAKRDRRL